MNARTDRLDALLGTSEPAFCEQIICLSDDPLDAHWWIDLLEEGTTVFDKAGRIRTAKLAECPAEVEHSVSHGYRPLLFVPRPMDWPAVYEAIGRYRNFARLYVHGRDDSAMRRLLLAPSPDVLNAYANHQRLIVPDLAYGKALDQWLITRLEDFQKDQEAVPAATKPWQKAGVYVSRLNPFRLLEVNLDRIAGEVTLHQWYATADPEGPREPCEIAVPLPKASSLVFDQGLCQLDLKRADEVKAVCEWLGVRPLVTVGRSDIGPIARVGDAIEKAKVQILDQLQLNGKKHDFLAWMRAWREGYFAGTPLQPRGVKPIEWVARALEEVIQEFQLLNVLRIRATPLPTCAGPAEDKTKTLEERLADVAVAFSLEGDASGQPLQDR